MTSRSNLWLGLGLSRALVIGCAAILSAMAHGAPIEARAIRVIDGDTVAVGTAHFRLVGFDTPEKGPRARCPAERELANRAAARLRQIIAAGGADLEEVACSCRPGTQGTPACNYGRRCGILTAAGRDVGPILITEGLARPYPFDWRHRPPAAHWCGERP